MNGFVYIAEVPGNSITCDDVTNDDKRDNIYVVEEVQNFAGNIPFLDRNRTTLHIILRTNDHLKLVHAVKHVFRKRFGSFFDSQGQEYFTGNVSEMIDVMYKEHRNPSISYTFINCLGKYNTKSKSNIRDDKEARYIAYRCLASRPDIFILSAFIFSEGFALKYLSIVFDLCPEIENRVRFIFEYLYHDIRSILFDDAIITFVIEKSKINENVRENLKTLCDYFGIGRFGFYVNNEEFCKDIYNLILYKDFAKYYYDRDHIYGKDITYIDTKKYQMFVCSEKLSTYSVEQKYISLAKKIAPVFYDLMTNSYNLTNNRSVRDGTFSNDIYAKYYDMIKTINEKFKYFYHIRTERYGEGFKTCFLELYHSLKIGGYITSNGPNGNYVLSTATNEDLTNMIEQFNVFLGPILNNKDEFTLQCFVNHLNTKQRVIHNDYHRPGRENIKFNK